MEKVKSFLKKDNFTKTKLLIAFIIAFLVAMYYTKTRTFFVIDRIFLLTAILFFIELHFILKLDKMYGFIYKYRYQIALSAFLIAIIFNYNGSSIGVYNEIIQGESNDKYFSPVLGKYRSIRSDEWVVNTPIFISQAIDKDSPFSYNNDNLRGTSTDMNTVVAAPVKDILILARPFNIGFILLGASRGLAVLWAGKWISLILVAFEFFMLITNKNKKVSLLGMMLVVFSASTAWWNSTDVLFWGMLALLLIDKFLSTRNFKVKLACAVGIFISSISYVFIMYPAWQLPFGYIYLALFIYLCIKNKEIYKLEKKDFLIIIPIVLGVIGIGLRYLLLSKDALNMTLNTSYPGKRFEIGGNGIKILFSYVYSYLFPFIAIDNPCELAGMLSFYPLPTILAVIYLIRNKDSKKHLGFFIPLLILSVLFSVFALFKTNNIFAKITLLYMSTGTRITIPLGFIQILLLTYLISIVNKDTLIFKNLDFVKIFSIVISVIIFIIAIKTSPITFGSLKSYLLGLILLIFIYLIFTINIEKNKNLLIIGLILMAIMTGAFVNPIQKGISVITDKPVSKEIQKIVNDDSNNNLWFTNNTSFFIPGYLLANGAKVINSVNTYPNFDLYKIVLGEEESQKEENKYIYNRYNHLTMEITKDTNKVEILFGDAIKLYLTPEKVKAIGAKYILSTESLEKFNTENVKFQKIYEEQGIDIYKVNY